MSILPCLMKSPISDDPKFRKFLDISSAHITKEDCKILEAMGAKNSSEYVEGIYVIDLDPEPGLIVILSSIEDSRYEIRENFQKKGLSLAFVDLYDYCVDNKLTGMWIDPDAPEYEGPPRFSW